MRRENDEQTLEILKDAFHTLEKIGIRSNYTREYLRSATHMYALQKALNAINRHKSSQAVLEIESLEETLKLAAFDALKL